MVDVVPGTQVRMRIDRRFSHYNPGDLIAVDFWQGRDLEAKRLATPLDLLVPAVADGDGPPSVPPQRQPPPGSIIRK